MNKLFTSLAALSVALSMSAEVPQLLHDNVVLANGATYEVGYEAVTYGTFTMYTTDAHLFAKCSNNANIAVVISADKSGIQFCAWDNCEQITPGEGNAVTKKGSLVADVATDLKIERTTTSTVPTEEITVTVTAYDVTAPNETTTVTVKFMPEDAETVAARQGSAAISAVAAAANFVKMTAARTLAYRLPAATTLAIYNISGVKVVERTLSGEGTLALDRLPRGIYVYQAAGLTGKLLVK